MSGGKGSLKYRELIELFDNCKSVDELRTKVMPQYPDECLITGCRKCESYYFDEGIVFLPEPAYDAYTLPSYNSEEKCFECWKIDMDDEFRRDYTVLCDLSHVLEWSNFKKIKEFYEIPDEDVEWAKKELAEIDRQCGNC